MELLQASRTRVYFREPRKAGFSSFLAFLKTCSFDLVGLSPKRIASVSNLGDCNNLIVILLRINSEMEEQCDI